MTDHCSILGHASLLAVFVNHQNSSSFFNLQKKFQPYEKEVKQKISPYTKKFTLLIE